MKPFLTIAGLFIAPTALIHFGSDALRAALLFQRTALAQGEWWRLITGHWVHFSSWHALANLAALIMIGFQLERLRPGTLARFVLLAAPAIGTLLWLLEPGMRLFGGLSGIACGSATLLALISLSATRSTSARLCWSAILVAIGVKVAADMFAVPVFPRTFHAIPSVRVSSWAHAAGAFIATVFFVSQRRNTSGPLNPTGELAS